MPAASHSASKSWEPFQTRPAVVALLNRLKRTVLLEVRRSDDPRILTPAESPCVEGATPSPALRSLAPLVCEQSHVPKLRSCPPQSSGGARGSVV
jgi:hypothetical protein